MSRNYEQLLDDVRKVRHCFIRWEQTQSSNILADSIGALQHLIIVAARLKRELSRIKKVNMTAEAVRELDELLRIEELRQKLDQK